MKKLLFLLFALYSVSCHAFDVSTSSTCLLAWIFDAGTGTLVEDETTGNHDGTFLGADHPAWGSASPPTNYDAYVDYDDTGDDDYINTPDDTDFDFIQNAESFTVYLCTDFSIGVNYSRIAIKQEGATGDGWQIVLNGTEIAFVKENGGTQVGYDLATMPAGGAWHEYFIQYNAVENKARTYNDKSATEWFPLTTSMGFGWGTDALLSLGGRATVANYSIGSKIAAFAIWNKLLKTTEMDDISDNGITGAIAGGAAPKYVPQILILE